jgi:hypothetical protein
LCVNIAGVSAGYVHAQLRRQPRRDRLRPHRRRPDLLAFLLRIPVYMHDAAKERVFQPAMRAALGTVK